MSNQRFLVLLDTDRIHDYVFATNKLKEIRGGSAILDDLNLLITFGLLPKDKGNFDKNGDVWEPNGKTMANGLEWEAIFIGGGSGKIIFEDGDKAKRFCLNLERKYYKKTNGQASITTTVVPFDDTTDEKFKESIYKGEKKLRQRKDSKYQRIQPLSNHYFQFCQSTGRLPAETTEPKDIGDDISASSYQKRYIGKSRENPFYKRFKTFLEEEKPENEKLLKEVKSNWHQIDNEIKDLLPEDLNAIGKLNNGYIGLLYADGNRMAERLKKLNSTSAYLNFSQIVKNNAEAAIYESLAKILLAKVKYSNDFFPFEILLLGGDDLLLVVPANKAIEVALKFCEGFKTRTQEECANNAELKNLFVDGISVSAGIVITHANYPIHQMISHAEALLRNAKLKSNIEKDKEINTVDFMVLKGAMLQGIKEMRESELTDKSDINSGKELRLYQRPYTDDELNELIEKIRNLKENEFPRSRLKQMYESLFRGKHQAMLDYLLILSRLKADLCDEIKSNFIPELQLYPWKEEPDAFVTPFLDIIELFDFIDEES